MSWVFNCELIGKVYKQKSWNIILTNNDIKNKYEYSGLSLMNSVNRNIRKHNFIILYM